MVSVNLVNEVDHTIGDLLQEFIRIYSHHDGGPYCAHRVDAQQLLEVLDAFPLEFDDGKLVIETYYLVHCGLSARLAIVVW